MKQYFFHDGQNQQGPFDFEQLKNSKLSKENMVWCEGMETWKPAGEIEELKTLFTVVPPPLPKNVNAPPPLELKSQPVPTADNTKNKKLLYILLGAGAGTILIAALIILLIYKSCNSGIEKGLPVDSLAVQTDSIKSGVTNDTKGNNAAQNVKAPTTNEDVNALDAKQKEEAQKETYRKSWSKHVFARANYSSGPFGIIVNPTVTVTNSMPYSLNEVTVWLNYMLSTGGTWRSEKVTFYNIGPNSTSTKNAPPTDRGSSIQTRISKVSSSSLGLYYSN